jgi:glycine betaine/proline transport system substrate-binding protein
VGTKKMVKRLLVLMVAFAVAALVAGCGGSGSNSTENKSLTLGIAGGWTENEAISNLTKVVLEEDLGYQKVETKVLDLGLVFEGVAGGDLNTFQDVWLPNHKDYMAKVGDDVEHLGPWYEGQTTFGLAVPAYMADTKSIADLNQSGATEIIGIEPGAVISDKVENNVIPAYNLKLDYKPSSTAAMLAEVDRLYKDKKPFVFPPWCPNPMCGHVEGVFPTKEYGGLYDFRYLEDPKNAQGNLDQPAKISSIVDKNLSKDDPVAYAFVKTIRLNAGELVSLEDEINKAGDPVEGSKAWLKNNHDVVQPAIDAAKQAQGS